MNFILDGLSGLEEISCRAMTREYFIYCKGKIIGGIYDERLIIKSTKEAVACMSDASYELPHKGAKKMQLVSEADDG